MVPIVIICYNNHEYVDNMIKTIRNINSDYVANILIVDNRSERQETIQFLKNTDVRVHFNQHNEGPWVNEVRNSHIYNTLPQHFILTDPDLQLNPNLPSDFIEQMVAISARYPHFAKIGLGLDISDSHLFFQELYVGNNTIAQHESVFWTNKLDDPDYDIYPGSVDTTFNLVNKASPDIERNHVRLGGVFACKHIPWYKKNPILGIYKNYMLAKTATHISTTARLIKTSIEKEYARVTKNDQLLLIEDNPQDKNLHFWKDVFSSWETSTFQIFDKFLHADKTCIDIGGWIGTTCIYASRKSKDVYAIEADPKSYQDMVRNCEINGCTNVVPIYKAIFNESHKQITIVGDNDSISQIKFDGSGHPVETITIADMISQYSIDPLNVSLIKVDIEGAEEFILDDLYALHTAYNIPLLVSFHLSFFNDKNLNRFKCLTEEDKALIRNVSFPSILFANGTRQYVA